MFVSNLSSIPIGPFPFYAVVVIGNPRLEHEYGSRFPIEELAHLEIQRFAVLDFCHAFTHLHVLSGQAGLAVGMAMRIQEMQIFAHIFANIALLEKAPSCWMWSI